MQSPSDAALHESLEREADRLLREHAERYKPLEYPFYAASSLRQISRKDELVSLRELPGEAGGSCVATRLLDRLDEQVELSETNRELLCMIRAGLGRQETADRLGLTYKAVGRRLDRIMARLRHAGAAGGGYERLVREVYADEVRPRRYAPEQHCKPGSEACRRDGYCKYRWYLYALSAQSEPEQ